MGNGSDKKRQEEKLTLNLFYWASSLKERGKGQTMKGVALVVTSGLVKMTEKL